MLWFIVMHLFSTLLEWVKIGRLAEQEKDLEKVVTARSGVVTYLEESFSTTIARPRSPVFLVGWIFWTIRLNNIVLTIIDFLHAPNAARQLRLFDASPADALALLMEPW